MHDLTPLIYGIMLSMVAVAILLLIITVRFSWKNKDLKRERDIAYHVLINQLGNIEAPRLIAEATSRADRHADDEYTKSEKEYIIKEMQTAHKEVAGGSFVGIVQ